MILRKGEDHVIKQGGAMARYGGNHKDARTRAAVVAFEPNEPAKRPVHDDPHGQGLNPIACVGEQKAECSFPEVFVLLAVRRHRDLSCCSAISDCDRGLGLKFSMLYQHTAP
jgi:hypothetical protein